MQSKNDTRSQNRKHYRLSNHLDKLKKYIQVYWHICIIFPVSPLHFLEQITPALSWVTFFSQKQKTPIILFTNSCQDDNHSCLLIQIFILRLLQIIQCLTLKDPTYKPPHTCQNKDGLVVTEYSISLKSITVIDCSVCQFFSICTSDFTSRNILGKSKWLETSNGEGCLSLAGATSRSQTKYEKTKL